MLHLLSVKLPMLREHRCFDSCCQNDSNTSKLNDHSATNLTCRASVVASSSCSLLMKPTTTRRLTSSSSVWAKTTIPLPLLLCWAVWWASCEFAEALWNALFWAKEAASYACMSYKTSVKDGVTRHRALYNRGDRVIITTKTIQKATDLHRLVNGFANRAQLVTDGRVVAFVWAQTLSQ